MSKKQKRKRQLHPDELRFVLFAKDVASETSRRQQARLHLMRETVHGRKIAACTYGSIQLHSGAPYYSFPFLRWWLNAAPICHICAEIAMEVAQQFTPVSNTGVNSTGEPDNDAE